MFPKKKRKSKRILERDGKFNIIAENYTTAFWSDLYHKLLSVSWPRFFFYNFGIYIFINFAFGTAYYICGPGALEGIHPLTEAERFLDCFFFSVQTLATIGYGKIVPEGLPANILATIESMFGLLLLAVTTGLVFSRFARPTARVSFSRQALVITQDGAPGLVFRIANERLNRIVQANVEMILVRDEVTPEGEIYRTIYDLPLKRSHTPLFLLTWTIVHPITPESPLHKMTPEEWKASNAEILVTLTGMDDIFHQDVYVRFSYTIDDLVWNRRFANMMDITENGTTINLSKLHDTEPIN